MFDNFNIDMLLDIRSYLIDKSKIDSPEMFNYYQIEIGIIEFLLIKCANEITEGFTIGLESSAPGK